MTETAAAGAKHRHGKRIAKWAREVRLFPKARHDACWIVHNVVSHPALGVWPSPATVWFHDWTSQRLNRRRTMVRSPLPKIPVRSTWVKHNVLAHAAIGLVPSAIAFAWHDRTAEEMNVFDWI
jgi:hypothetical protein